MPHANIWIKKVNEEAWRSIKDKSDWVNQRLSRDQFVPVTKEEKPVIHKEEMKDDKWFVPKFETPPYHPQVTTGDKIRKKLCEHGQVRGQCFQKGCKFGRFK